MTYAEKKRKRIEEIIPLSDRIRKEGCVPHDSRDAIIASIERLHSRREALLKAASIARSMLAKTKPGEDADRFRKAAEEMKHEADWMGEKMVAVWMDGEV